MSSDPPTQLPPPMPPPGAAADSEPQSQPAVDTLSPEVMYQVKAIDFFGRRTAVLYQNHNGPCSLLAICNLLLLKNEIRISSDAREVSQHELLSLVAERFIMSSNSLQVKDEDICTRERKVAEAIDLLPRLTTGININLMFRKIDDFVFTPEHAIFDFLDIPLYHGWVIDPQDTETAAAIGSKSYDDLTGGLAEFISLKPTEESTHMEEETVDFAAATTAALKIPSPTHSRGRSVDELTLSKPAKLQMRRGDLEEEEELMRVLNLSKADPVEDAVDGYFSSDTSQSDSSSNMEETSQNESFRSEAHGNYAARDDGAMLQDTDSVRNGSEVIPEESQKDLICKEPEDSGMKNMFPESTSASHESVAPSEEAAAPAISEADKETSGENSDVEIHGPPTGTEVTCSSSGAACEAASSHASTVVDEKSGSLDDSDESETFSPNIQESDQYHEGDVVIAEHSDTEAKHERELIDNFLCNTADQLTVYGLFSLQEGLTEGELCVFFCNNHFSTMLKHKDNLYLLVTDQGFLSQTNLVWQTLDEAKGDRKFLTSNFMPFKAEMPTYDSWNEQQAMTNTGDDLAQLDNSTLHHSSPKSLCEMADELLDTSFVERFFKTSFVKHRNSIEGLEHKQSAHISTLIGDLGASSAFKRGDHDLVTTTDQTPPTPYTPKQRGLIEDRFLTFLKGYKKDGYFWYNEFGTLMARMGVFEVKIDYSHLQEFDPALATLTRIFFKKINSPLVKAATVFFEEELRSPCLSPPVVKVYDVPSPNDFIPILEFWELPGNSPWEETEIFCADTSEHVIRTTPAGRIPFLNLVAKLFGNIADGKCYGGRWTLKDVFINGDYEIDIFRPYCPKVTHGAIIGEFTTCARQMIPRYNCGEFLPAFFSEFDTCLRTYLSKEPRITLSLWRRFYNFCAGFLALKAPLVRSIFYDNAHEALQTFGRHGYNLLESILEGKTLTHDWNGFLHEVVTKNPIFKHVYDHNMKKAVNNCRKDTNRKNKKEKNANMGVSGAPKDAPKAASGKAELVESEAALEAQDDEISAQHEAALEAQVNRIGAGHEASFTAQLAAPLIEAPSETSGVKASFESSLEAQGADIEASFTAQPYAQLIEACSAFAPGPSGVKAPFESSLEVQGNGIDTDNEACFAAQLGAQLITAPSASAPAPTASAPAPSDPLPSGVKVPFVDNLKGVLICSRNLRQHGSKGAKNAHGDQQLKLLGELDLVMSKYMFFMTEIHEALVSDIEPVLKKKFGQLECDKLTLMLKEILDLYNAPETAKSAHVCFESHMERAVLWANINDNSEEALQILDEFFMNRDYVNGCQISKDDVTAFQALSTPPPSNYINVARWYNSVSEQLHELYNACLSAVLQKEEEVCSDDLDCKFQQFVDEVVLQRKSLYTFPQNKAGVVCLDVLDHMFQQYLDDAWQQEESLYTLSQKEGSEAISNISDEIIYGAGLNNSGNNCFLNAIIQSLWHLRGFSYELNQATLRHKHLQDAEEEKNCVVCALNEVFIKLGQSINSQGESVSSSSLSIALSSSSSSTLFQQGKMGDASAAFEAILNVLHSSCANKSHEENMGLLDSCECIAHQFFQSQIYLKCEGCDMKYEYNKDTTYCCYVSPPGHVKNTSPNYSFDNLLNEVMPDVEVTCNCGAEIELLPVVALAPRVFTVVFEMDDEVFNKLVLSRISTYIDINVVYSGLDGTRVNTHSLVSLISFSRSQYYCFACKDEFWIMFSDHIVEPVGSWDQVVEKCCELDLCPLVLFYEAVAVDRMT